MGTPQIIYVILTAISLLGAAHLHGKPRENYNFWTALIGVALGYTLLIWGGFFR